MSSSSGVCSICLETVGSTAHPVFGRLVATLLESKTKKCGHSFCYMCIGRHLSMSVACPNCRHNGCGVHDRILLTTRGLKNPIVLPATVFTRSRNLNGVIPASEMDPHNIFVYERTALHAWDLEEIILSIAIETDDVMQRMAHRKLLAPLANLFSRYYISHQTFKNVDAILLGVLCLRQVLGIELVKTSATKEVMQLEAAGTAMCRELTVYQFMKTPNAFHKILRKDCCAAWRKVSELGQKDECIEFGVPAL